MKPEDVLIRPATSHADYLGCQNAQKLAWGIVDDSYLVPISTLVGANLHGGLVLGAFLPDGQVIGLSFAFLGRLETELCLYSQLTGVVPGYQGQGFGERLKVAQRDFARSQGLASIAWAFDPLQAGNARFNFNKLGVTASRYLVDMYGSRSDAINRNAATDRLIARWSTSGRPEMRPDLESASNQACQELPRLIDPSTVETRGFPNGKPRALLLEIPQKIQKIRETKPELAKRWTLAVRRAFVEAFDLGYQAVGIWVDDSGSTPRSFYRLDDKTGADR